MLKLFSVSAVLVLASYAALAAPGDPPAPSPAPAQQPAPAERGGRAPSGLMRYDTNKDGVVDRAEWKAGQEARFRRLDANGDGKLTKEELFAGTPGANAGANGVMPTDRQAQRQSTYFQLLDANKDGVVTLAEFLTQADRNFARCDLNNDGRIDTAECRQALQRRPSER
ncbi:MAG: EF-hand domain-containing protein [Reyranellaceae bacterium]